MVHLLQRHFPVILVLNLEAPLTNIAARLAPHDPATHLRLAAVADEPFLHDLYTSSRAGEFIAAGLPPAALGPLLAQQYRAQAAGYAVQFPDAISLIILYRGAPAGRLILEAGDRRWRIVDIALLDAMRGRGIGSDIIEAVGRAAFAHGAHELCLAVLAGNAPARRLYERLGFVSSGDDGARIAMVRPLP